MWKKIHLEQRNGTGWLGAGRWNLMPYNCYFLEFLGSSQFTHVSSATESILKDIHFRRNFINRSVQPIQVRFDLAVPKGTFNSICLTNWQAEIDNCFAHAPSKPPWGTSWSRLQLWQGPLHFSYYPFFAHEAVQNAGHFLTGGWGFSI